MYKVSARPHKNGPSSEGSKFIRDPYNSVEMRVLKSVLCQFSTVW
jgi:hypothetical protein